MILVTAGRGARATTKYVNSGACSIPSALRASISARCTRCTLAAMRELVACKTLATPRTEALLQAVHAVIDIGARQVDF